MSRLALCVLVLLGTSLSACATTGDNWQSGWDEGYALGREAERDDGIRELSMYGPEGLTSWPSYGKFYCSTGPIRGRINRIWRADSDGQCRPPGY